MVKVFLLLDGPDHFQIKVYVIAGIVSRTVIDHWKSGQPLFNSYFCKCGTLYEVLC
jgi:hypothetical protein